MTRLDAPAEDQQGDYIEAAIHALNANNPRAALRYLEEGLDIDRRRAIAITIKTSGLREGLRLQDGESNE